MGGYGGALSLFGGVARGVAASQSLIAIESANKSSARTARAAADEAPRRAQWEITRLRLLKRKMLHGQAFAAARAGITMEGTPTDVAQLTEREVEIDTMQIYREGQIERLAYLEQEKQFKKAADRASQSGIFSMIGSIV